MTTNLVEKTTIVIAGERGTFNLVFEMNHDKGTSSLTMTGEPENLKEHRGTHVALASAMLEGLAKFYNLNPSVEDVS